MKITILTISYNQVNYLKRCIDSVVSQDYKNIEYIIVDPGSTDGSREVINAYGSNITKIFDKDIGPADGLNNGFAKASGDIFCFINSDDELIPKALSRIAAFFNVNKNVDVVTGCGYFIDNNDVRIRRIVPSKLTPWLYVHGGVSVFQQGTFFRPYYFKKVEGFNIRNSTCWDGELFLDMAIAGAKFATIGDDLAHFRLHEDGITGSGRLEEAYRKDTARLFFKTTGRKRNFFDPLQDLSARSIKGIYDPAYFYRRAMSLAALRKC